MSMNTSPSTKWQTQNGFTKESMIETVKRDFKGKAINLSSRACQYLTREGRKCVVGLFIPDGHLAQSSTSIAVILFRDYPDLTEKMPLTADGMAAFQRIHDLKLLYEDQTIREQRAILIKWIEENVA